MKKNLLLCFAAALLIAQCERPVGPAQVQDNSKGSFTCKVDMKTAPSNVQSLDGYMFRLRDSLSGIVDTIHFSFIVSNGFATTSVNNITPGTWMTTINARGNYDSLLYTGSSAVDVLPGQTSYVTIRLGPAGLGNVVFYVYWDTDTSGTDSLAPRIAVQPYDMTVRPGDSAQLALYATGAAPLSYVWQKSLWGGAWDSLPGSNDNWITIFPTVWDSAALYRCVVSNPYGQTVSNSVRIRVMDTVPPDTIPPDTSRHWFSTTDTLNANQSWREVRLPGLLPGDSLTIWPYGDWKVDAAHNGTYGPSGDTCHAAAGKTYVIPGAPKGALVGRIGASGKPFLINSYWSGAVNDSGALYVVANERLGNSGSYLKDNSGFMQVNAWVTRY